MVEQRLLPFLTYIEGIPSVHTFFDIFVSIPKGPDYAPYLFIVFIAGGLFHILQRTGALGKCHRYAVIRFGIKNRNQSLR